MYRTERSKVGHLARAGLALAAFLLMLPAPAHAVTLNVTDDAFISLSNTAKNFGSRKSVKVDGLIGREGFAKFDLSVLGGATSSDIDAANLRIWITKVKVAGSIEIRRVLGAWTEDTLTGDTALADFSLGPLIVPILSSDKGSFVLVDLTSLVKDWVGGISDNDGITLIAVAGTRVIIDAKEGKKTSHPMEIEVILGASSSIIGGSSNASGSGGLTGGGTTEFMGMFYGDFSATEAFVQQIMPVAGTVGNLNVLIDTASAGDTWTVTVRKDPGPAPGGAPADTTVFCVIPVTGFTCSFGGTVLFAAGDLISIKVVPAGGATGTPMRWTAEFTP